MNEFLFEKVILTAMEIVAAAMTRAQPRSRQRLLLAEVPRKLQFDQDDNNQALHCHKLRQLAFETLLAVLNPTTTYVCSMLRLSPQRIQAC